MKKLLIFVLSIFFIGSLSTISFAQLHAFLYVDSAPNVYGSPEWDPWLAATYAAVSAGTFINMSNGINPANIGSSNPTEFEIQDEVVYSFGDLGKRLTWIYWIPGTSVATLGSFQIALTNIWDGDVLDFYEDYYGSTWVTPTRWQDYNDGVIGTAGMAWWGAYNTNTQAELDADINSWIQSEETWIFYANLNGTITSIESHRGPIPEPGTFLLLGFGLLGLAGLSRKKFLKK